MTVIPIRNAIVVSLLYLHCAYAATDIHSVPWYMPDETALHTRTWMAFGANQKIWGKKLLPKVQENLASIALTIAKYEPVTVLVRETDMDLARQLMGSSVELIACPLDDIWLRDSGPVFVMDAKGQKAGIDFNFNGWGSRQTCEHDALLAGLVSREAGVDTVMAGLVLEGGAIEVDGHGMAIIAESCVLNSNRNPGVSKADCEKELKRLLGVEKIIWLPGIQGKDVTDGHTDFYARFVKKGVVVVGFEPDPDSYDHAVTKQHIQLLQSATDASGQPLEVVVLEAPSIIREQYACDDFAAGYMNFYVCNGAVIIPEFGDSHADRKAKEVLQMLFPGRAVEQINIDAIAAGGGGIHCVTQQEPAPKVTAH